MKKNKRNAVIKGILAIVFVALVIVLAVIFLRNFIMDSPAISGLLSKGTSDVIYVQNSPLEQQVDFQVETDEMLLAELASGYYSPEEPLVIVNPYNLSPLTALVLFQTAEPAQISVHIPGTIEQTAVDFTFDGYLTDHIIPIYGLYADTENQVAVTIAYTGGTTEVITIPVETEKLDSSLADLIITTSLPQPEAYYPGFNLCYRIGYTYKSILALDALGCIRLQLKTASLGDTSANEQLMDYNGHFLKIFYADETTYVFVELDALGRIYRAVSFNMGLPHHDMLSLDGGDRLLVLCSGIDSIAMEDMIAELDMTTGKIIRTLDLKTVLQTSRNQSPSVELDNDPFHVNTIIAIDGSDDIIISSRNQNQIVRLSWPDGEIKWIAGDPTGISPMYEEYYLTPVGEDFTYFYRQHAPMIMTDFDNDPNTIDLLVFDNGTTRGEFDDSITDEDLYSRMVHYRIDEENMTIEQIREYGREYGLALYSDIRGDADELPNLNWLGTFDVSVGTSLINKAPTYVEVDQNNELVWMMQIVRLQEGTDDSGIGEYRVERQSLYNDAANDLQLGVQPLVLLKD